LQTLYRRRRIRCRWGSTTQKTFLNSSSPCSSSGRCLWRRGRGCGIWL